jgi:ACR3 family arsenite transporter
MLLRLGPSAVSSHEYRVAMLLSIHLHAAILTRFLLCKLLGVEWYEKVFFKWLAPWSYKVNSSFTKSSPSFEPPVPLIVYLIIMFLFALYTCNQLGYGYTLEAT